MLIERGVRISFDLIVTPRFIRDILGDKSFSSNALAQIFPVFIFGCIQKTDAHNSSSRMGADSTANGGN